MSIWRLCALARIGVVWESENFLLSIRLSLENGAGGKTIIRLKYGVEEGGWLTKVVRGIFGVGLWKEIYKESFSIKQ